MNSRCGGYIGVLWRPACPGTYARVYSVGIPDSYPPPSQGEYRWFEAAFEAVYRLDSFPDSHSVAYENDDFPYEIRELRFGLGSRPSYRAVFTIEENTVHVLTGRSASQETLRPDDVDFDANPDN